MEKLLKPKIDVVFHALFREENKRLIEGLIGDILGEKVKVITTNKDRFLNLRSAEQKLGIIDLRTELQGGVKCNIEVQLLKQPAEIDRMLYYWSDAYSRQLVRGEDYRNLKKTISIIILDHEIEELKEIDELGIKWQIRNNKGKSTILTNQLEIVIIEIPKAKRMYKENKKNKIAQWMILFDNPNDKEVKEIVKENVRIKETVEDLEEISGDEDLKRIAFLREKWRKDYTTGMNYATEEGEKRGEKIGEERGKILGKAEEKLRMAKELLEQNIDIVVIEKVTKLSKEEIEKIQKAQ